MFLCYGICFGKPPRPSLEGRIIKIKEENSILARIELGIPTEFYRRLEFETGEENYINVGVSTKVTPYYAKIKYLLDPGKPSSPYYLFSTGVNLIEGEDIGFDKFLNDFAQRVNYGVGVGVVLKNVEVEVLYGKYNYQNIRIPEEEESLYSSTKITFGCKYKF